VVKSANEDPKFAELAASTACRYIEASSRLFEVTPMSRPVTPVIDAALQRHLRRALRDAVPTHADFALVCLAARQQIVYAATAHATAQGDRLLRALAKAHRIPRRDTSSTVARVVAHGRAITRNRIHPEDVPIPAPGGVGDLHRRLAPRAALVVPIQAGNRVVGALTLCYAASRRAYSPADLPAARALALRVAQILTPPDAHARVRTAARQPRQGTTVRRRMGPRD
jgi:GAF domain-containing protein